MTTDANLKIIQKCYQDFAVGNIEGILNALADDVIWYSPGDPDLPIAGKYKGKDQVLKFFQNLDKYLNFEIFEPIDFLAAGNRVIVLGRSDTTVKETGKRVRDDWAMLWKIENGKVVDYRLFEDTNANAKAFKK